ncbi:hypothetical protein L3V66_12575, partial [Secundilactobacillus sp. HBUAS58055]|uniref:hypothetical protein n=1 Tax=Secundilactobacillus angelensis TaxID=2722706 RepID=UPI001F0E8708
MTHARRKKRSRTLLGALVGVLALIVELLLIADPEGRVACVPQAVAMDTQVAPAAVVDGRARELVDSAA